MSEEYKQKSFQFWVSYFDTAIDLDDEERLAFYDAVMGYIFFDIDPEEELKKQMKSNAYFAFKGIKANLKTSKHRAACGAKGGRPKDEECDSSGVLHEEKQTESKNDFAFSNEKANGNQNDNKEKEKEKEKVKEKDKEKEKGKKPTLSFGTFKNVFLTAEQRSDLERDISNPSSLIDDFSAYMQSSGKTYADHYATLMQWAQRNGVLKLPKKRCARDGCTSLLYMDGPKGWTCPIHGTRGVVA